MGVEFTFSGMEPWKVVWVATQSQECPGFRQTMGQVEIRTLSAGDIFAFRVERLGWSCCFLAGFMPALYNARCS